jgi:hypothetical protein
VTGVFYETLENAQITARLVGHDVYLKSKYNGWILSSDKLTAPFYVISLDGGCEEVTK